MTESCATQPICIAGVYVKSDKYPDVKYKLEALKRLDLDFIEYNKPAIKPEGKWSSTGTFNKILSLVYNSLTVLFLCVKNRSSYSVLFIPYPSLVLCFFMSWMPGFARPKRIAMDMFISIYDTVVLNRKLLKKGGIPAKILMWIERRSLSVADVVVVDTPQNATFISMLFGIEMNKVVNIPLATGYPLVKANTKSDISEKPIDSLTKKPASCVQVLFIGTMVPLHGIETILQAIKKLQGREIQFTLVGDGQDSGLIEAFLYSNKVDNITWIREWQNVSQVHRLIEDADICLGIFSTSDKAQRVCPLKIYHYMSHAKPMITGETNWTKGVSKVLKDLPFLTVPCGESMKLANSILELSGNQSLRAVYSQRASKYYEQHLEDSIGGMELKQLLIDLSLSDNR